ncbi:hypothetical protein [Methylocystis heyeri]|nr:hypothetical protein [Methylocystis heyeri]
MRSALAALALFAAAPGAALAAGWHYYDPECPISLGGKSMKFVAMQPKRNIDRVCDALGDVGSTVIALDAPDPELREMLWDIRVLRDSGRPDGEENIEADTVFKLPPEKYRNGMVNFDYSFAAADKYILLVRVKSDDGAREYVGRHHFTVGLLDNADLYAYAGFGLFVAAVGGGFAYVKLRKRKSAASA